MDALTATTANLSLSSSASAAPSPSFRLHVLDLSSTTEDASIELSTAAANYLTLEWSEQDAAEQITVSAVKQRIFALKQQCEAPASAASASANPAAALATSSLELEHMRLVFLTQRVPPPSAADAVASTSSAATEKPPAAATCRPLTDLGDGKLLAEYGVASHSWLLLKRKFTRSPQQQPQEEQEENGEEEEYEQEEEEAQEHEHAHCSE